MKKQTLNASGELRVLAEQWWKSRFKSRIVHVFVKGDGYLRFIWDDGQEEGSYHLPLQQLYAEMSTRTEASA